MRTATPAPGLIPIRNAGTATVKLGQFYAAHIAIVPILLLLFNVWHYYLIQLKGISLPFWLRTNP